MLRERKNKTGSTRRVITEAQMQKIVWMRCQGETQKQIAKKLGYYYTTIHNLINYDEDYKRIEKEILDESRERIVKRFSFLILKAMKKHLDLLDTKDDELALKAVELMYKVNDKLFKGIDVWEIEKSKKKDENISEEEPEVNADWGYLMNREQAKNLMDKVNGNGQ